MFGPVSHALGLQDGNTLGAMREQEIARIADQSMDTAGEDTIGAHGQPVNSIGGSCTATRREILPYSKWRREAVRVLPPFPVAHKHPGTSVTDFYYCYTNSDFSGLVVPTHSASKAFG